MTTTDIAPRRTARPKLRKIALPAEHGSWGFTLEPIALGLLSAPTWGGAGLAVAAFFVFLLRWPLKIARSPQRSTQSARQRLARRIVLLYALIIGAALLFTLPRTGLAPLWPLLIAAPFGLLFLFFDHQNQTRTLLAEWVGPIAFGAAASVIALAGGWQPWPAVALWAALIARAIPAVLFVRARIRLDKGRESGTLMALAAHLGGLVAVGLLVQRGLLSTWALPIFVLLLARAAWGLSPWRRPVPIKVIGIAELLWGALTVLALGLG